MTLDERTELSIDDCRYISEMPKGQFNVACKNLNLWNEAGINEENATEALFKLDDLLKQENLKYWLVYGTALGFCRDGNFIPWDDDIDIHVEANEFEPKFHPQLDPELGSEFEFEFKFEFDFEVEFEFDLDIQFEFDLSLI